METTILYRGCIGVILNIIQALQTKKPVPFRTFSQEEMKEWSLCIVVPI